MAQVIPRSDAALQEDVLRELRWDTRVEAAEVGVEVDNGVVTLTGTVSSYLKKLAAQEAAHRVSGVLDVVDNLTVQLPGSGERTDTDLAAAVRHALAWDPLIPHEQIQTTVAHGWVTLEGTLERWRQRVDAEHAVRHLVGVQGVTNRITVRPPEPAVEATTVRMAIEAALERQVAREAARITVQGDGGVVTLEGRVRSWAEKQAVLGAAGHAPVWCAWRISCASSRGRNARMTRARPHRAARGGGRRQFGRLRRGRCGGREADSDAGPGEGTGGGRGQRPRAGGDRQTSEMAAQDAEEAA